MREDVTLTYRCDGKGRGGAPCYARAVVWEERGAWLSRDLMEQEILLPSDHLQGLGFPAPPFWNTVQGSHFCPDHSITLHAREEVGGIPRAGRAEEFYVVGGLTALEKT